MGIVGLVHPALSAPGDVLLTDVPVLSSEPPQARTIQDGDGNVSLQTGAFQYHHAIEVPPGRLGVEPSLALSYSSQGALRGGIAAGWSLDLPEIRLDPRQSELAEQDPDHVPILESTLAGGHRLIQVNEPAAIDVVATFRAQYDPTYARYEQVVGSEWRVRTSDGRTHYFGEFDHQENTGDLERFRLSRTVDEHGNSVDYFWQPVYDGTLLVDHVLGWIDYTSNEEADLPAHARVVFSYSTPQSCDSSSAPVGAQLEQRAGVLRYRGSRRLDSIVTMVRSSPSATYRTVRTTALTYDAEASSCFRDRGALRLLTSIQESAVSPTGETTAKPAVTFTYGPLERNLTAARAFGRLGTELPALHAGTRANRELRHFWPTLEATLIDIDGDGRLDRVTEWPFEDCAFQWDRNTGNSFGDDGGVVAFPTFRHVPGSECSLAGHIINANLERPACSEEENNDSYLSYRFLDMNSDGLSDLVAAVHYNPHYYDPELDDIAQSRWGLEQACLASRATCSDVSEVCATDDCDIDDEETDRQLAAASKVPCHTLMDEPGEEPDEADDGGGEPPPTTCRPQHRQPLTACGTYPWEIYWNLGNGEFNMDEPTLVFQPLPLESDFGDSSLGNSGRLGTLTSTDHAIIDLDGDGYLDGAIRSTSNPNLWTVFRGDGSGTFRPRSDGLPYLWSVPSGPPRMYLATTFNERDGDNILGHVLSGSSLMDMNGDGFVDLLWADPTSSPTEIFVFLNKRSGFRSGSGGLLDSRTPLGTSGVRESLTIGQGELDFIDYGTRTTLKFPVDYDQDGWVDFFEKNPPPSEATRFRFGNGGGGLGSGRTLDATEAAGFPQVLDSPTLDHNWRIFRDFIDLDGDGVTEFVEPANGDIDGDGNADLWRMRQDQRDGSPMRLLRHIDNGAGGQIAVTYRASTDQQIDIPGTSDRLGMPTHTWLVQQVATSGLVDQAGSTQYRYGRPVWNPDDRGRYGFRGFEAVEMTEPAGSVVVNRYDYDLDWSGRLVERRSYDDADPSTPERRLDSIESTTWQRFELFDGAVASYQVVDQKQRECSGQQTYDQCLTSGALSVETTTWEPRTSYWDEDGPALLFAPTALWRKRADVIADGDRRTRMRYFVFSREDRYRIRPLNELTDERVSGSMQLRARTEYAYDIEGKAWQMATRYNSDGTHATDYTWLELPSGQVTGRRKPEQFASLTTRSHIAYDADQLYPAETRNELNHTTHTAYDAGTGALLSTRGPNSKPCGPSCVDWEETRTEIDGFGRSLRTFVNVENAETGRYESKLIERSTYFDAEQPQRVRHERLLDFEGDDWMVTDTTYDGFGRVRSRVEFRFEPGRPDAVYTFAYDSEGRLASFTAPDPSQDNGATVVYRYEYNSLGELRRVERPDESAIVWVRDGLRTTRTEEAASGPLSEKTTIRDVFGRLVQVDETLDDGGVATTTYQYDALNNVSRVTSADGVVTDLQHDWLGRRRRISRGDRAWRYDYDLNGNLIREIAPVPAGASEAAYTSSTVYDDLDRPTSRLAGVRALSAAEQRAINHGLVTYSYDEGQNGIGRVTAVASRDSVLSRAYSYDARGNPVSETLSFDLEPALGVSIADSREQHRIFLALAPFGLENVGDGLDQGTSTQVLTLPDHRGRAAALLLPNPTRFVAAAHHNAAGVVDSINGGGVEQRLTHDLLGRVTGMEVRSNAATPALQVSESFTYFGMDDPQTLTTFRQGLGTHQFEFDYDRRHQLTGATSDRGYEALFAYTPGGRLATAFVDSPNGAPLAPPRDVTYEYFASDPEAVSRLVTGEGDETFIAYGHDVSGNVVERTHAGGESLSFLYDGDDSQRRAVAADGSSEIYYYDHSNQRILTVTRRPDGTVEKVRLVFGKLEVEYAGDGSVTRTVAHLTLDRPVGRVVDRGAEQRVIHGHLGNLLAAFTPDGTELSTAFVYGPFGEILAESGDSDSYIHRFNGKEQDELTDLSYYGYRFFDPYSLTWTQADPLYRFAPDLAWDEPRRTNLYAFSLNNPLRYLDPDGKNPGRPPGPWAGPNIPVPPAMVGAAETGEAIVLAIPVGMEVGGDALSVVPVVGTLGDAISAAGSFLQGEKADGAISVAAMFIPGLGSAEAKGAKAIAEEAAEALGKYGDDAAKGTKSLDSGTRAARDTTAGHRKNKRESNRGKHEKGEKRRGRDQGGEAGDARRRPNRKPPPGHQGPWPRKPKQGNVSEHNRPTEGDDGRARFECATFD